MLNEQELVYLLYTRRANGRITSIIISPKLFHHYITEIEFAKFYMCFICSIHSCFIYSILQCFIYSIYTCFMYSILQCFIYSILYSFIYSIYVCFIYGLYTSWNTKFIRVPEIVLFLPSKKKNQSHKKQVKIKKPVM